MPRPLRSVRAAFALAGVTIVVGLFGGACWASIDRYLAEVPGEVAPQPVPVSPFSERRLLSPSSPWNSRATGPADPRSDQMIANLRQSTLRQGFSVNLSRYAIPIRYVDSAMPQVPVLPSRPWWRGMRAPIPDDAVPDPGTDHHLVIWETDSNLLYEFWQLVRTPAGWTSGYGVVFDAGGPGYQTTPNANSARAYGGSLAAGAIRHHEMRDGVIPHALAFAYPTTRGEMYAAGVGPGGVVAIASHADNDRAPNRMTDANIPLGARLRLKASVDSNQRCRSDRACLVIATALRDYGAFVVDTAGAPVFYAENLDGTTRSWNGLLSQGALRAFLAEDFEVLSLPPLSPAS